MRSFLILFILFIAADLQASEIIGKAPAEYAGLEVALIMNQEEISGFKNKEQSQKINSDGSFRFIIELSQTKKVSLGILLRNISFRISPDETVEVSIRLLDNPDNFTEPIKYTVATLKDNSKTVPDALYEQYASEIAHAISLIDSRKAPIELNPILENLFDSLNTKYEDELLSDIHFRNYANYQEANAALLGSYTREKLSAKYLSEKPVMYDDPLYLSFAEYLLLPRLENILFKNEKEVTRIYSEFNIYESLLTYLQSDTLFRNKELSSLAILLFARKHLFNTSDFRLKAIDILDQIKEFSEFDRQRLIAKNIFTLYHKLDVNTKAPDFTLSDRRNKEVSLSEFRKPVYLAFVIGGSTTFQRDRLLIEAQADKYKTLNFIFVLINFDQAQWLAIKAGKRKNVHFVYFNGDYNLLEQFGLKNPPLYFLVDAGGYLLQSPANAPSEMFEVFEKLTAKKSKYKSYEIVDD